MSMATPGEIQYFDRASGRVVTETVLGDGLLKWAYTSPCSGLLRWPLFGTACLSRLLGWYADLGISRRRIAPTVAQLGIRLEEFEVPEGGYRSFNEFFCRHIQPGARDFATRRDDRVLSSPADCRLLVWPQLQDDTCLLVKGTPFTVGELLGERGRQYAETFRNGSLCICRLCPADYHRYHFPASGEVLESWRLRGKYHSVNPVAIAAGFKVFSQNVRQVSILKYDKFGLGAFIEVGAFGVASINNTHGGGQFQGGEEKGYFTFGGSTIILVFAPQVVRFSEDIVSHSAQGLETLVKAGEEIART